MLASQTFLSPKNDSSIGNYKENLQNTPKIYTD